jgi:hypothetical protein
MRVTQSIRRGSHGQARLAPTSDFPRVIALAGNWPAEREPVNAVESARARGRAATRQPPGFASTRLVKSWSPVSAWPPRSFCQLADQRSDMLIGRHTASMRIARRGRTAAMRLLPNGSAVAWPHVQQLEPQSAARRLLSTRGQRTPGGVSELLARHGLSVGGSDVGRDLRK